VICWNRLGHEDPRYIAGDEPVATPAPPVQRSTEQPTLKVGDRVRYHGSLVKEHGEYIYQGFCACDASDDTYSPDCHDDLHQLARTDDPSFGIFHTRRSSFTLI
jgi:hypothetical protein